eukprot:scaffold47246_cov81-Phaeocystis_antarctica.AAC.6
MSIYWLCPCETREPGASSSKPVLCCEERTPKRPEVHPTSGCPVMLVKGPKRVGPRYGCAAARRLAEEVGQWKEKDVAVQLRVALQHGVETAPSRLIVGSIAALQCVRREAGWQTVGRTLLELRPIADEKQLRLLGRHEWLQNLSHKVIRSAAVVIAVEAVDHNVVRQEVLLELSHDCADPEAAVNTPIVRMIATLVV